MNKKSMNNERQKRPPLDPAQRLYFTLLVFAASLLASALVIIYNNSARSLPVFIFLLFLGVGIMLALGLVRGVLVGLFMIFLWIATKRLLGVWEQVRLLDALLELIIVGLTFIFSGIYHNRLQSILNVYKKNQNQLKQLDLEDKSIGLIKPSIGLLRLNEEEERSIRYRRPFALILIMVRPRSNIDWESIDMYEIMRSVATSIKDTTRDTDIPFLAGNQKIAVILPETDTNGANTVVNNIFNRMIATQFVGHSGNSIDIQRHVQLRFGFAAFLGTSKTKINLMEAAERSLEQSWEINSDEIFQNIFIEWETIGETPSSTPLFEKASS
jgi:GGDEF domain-containing protein